MIYMCFGEALTRPVVHLVNSVAAVTAPSYLLSLPPLSASSLLSCYSRCPDTQSLEPAYYPNVDSRAGAPADGKSGAPAGRQSGAPADRQSGAPADRQSGAPADEDSRAPADGASGAPAGASTSLCSSPRGNESKSTCKSPIPTLCKSLPYLPHVSLSHIYHVTMVASSAALLQDVPDVLLFFLNEAEIIH